MVTSPVPPVLTASAAVPLRPPIAYTTPSCATTLGTMYQPMSVAQFHSAAPVVGSNARIFPWIATISSSFPSLVFTTTGVFHASRMPFAFHFSGPSSCRTRRANRSPRWRSR